MSRVPADTFLSRLLVSTALAATLALSACGGDDPETATTPAAASTPVATTPADAAATSTTPGEAGPDVPTPKEPTREEAKAAIEETKRVAEEAAKGASATKQSTDDLTQQVKRANDALKAAGLQVGKPVVSGEESAALTVDNNIITVVFFRSPRDAAAAGAAAEKTFKESAQQVRVTRKANRLFLLSVPTAPTEKQIKTYQQVRKIVNGVA